MLRWLLVIAILLSAIPAAAQHLFTYTNDQGDLFIVDNLNKVPQRYRSQIPQEQVDRWNEDLGQTTSEDEPLPDEAAAPQPRDRTPVADGPALPFFDEASESEGEDPGLLSKESKDFMKAHFGAPDHMVRMPEDPIGEPGLAGFLNDQFRPAGVLLLSDDERREVDALEARWWIPLFVLLAIGIALMIVYWAHAALNAHLLFMAFCTFWSLVAGNVVGVVIGTVLVGGFIGTAVGLAPIIFYTWRYIRNLSARYALLAALLLTNAAGLAMAIDADRTISPFMEARGLAKSP